MVLCDHFLIDQLKHNPHPILIMYPLKELLSHQNGGYLIRCVCALLSYSFLNNLLNVHITHIFNNNKNNYTFLNHQALLPKNYTSFSFTDLNLFLGRKSLFFHQAWPFNKINLLQYSKTFLLLISWIDFILCLQFRNAEFRF